MSEPFPFLRLPAELQVKILEQYFPRRFSIVVVQARPSFTGDRYKEVESAG